MRINLALEQIVFDGRCPSCRGPVRVPYARFRHIEGGTTFQLIGSYPVHSGKCVEIFRDLKKLRGGIKLA